jgi:hypothetical protein
VTEQDLNISEVGACAAHPGGERVPQFVRVEPCSDSIVSIFNMDGEGQVLDLGMSRQLLTILAT